MPHPVEYRRFADDLQKVADGSLPLVVQLDGEGMDTALARSVDWGKYPNVKRLICDSTECGSVIDRGHTSCVHNRVI